MPPLLLRWRWVVAATSAVLLVPVVLANDEVSADGSTCQEPSDLSQERPAIFEPGYASFIQRGMLFWPGGRSVLLTGAGGAGGSFEDAGAHTASEHPPQSQPRGEEHLRSQADPLPTWLRLLIASGTTLAVAAVMWALMAPSLASAAPGSAPKDDAAVQQLRQEQASLEARAAELEAQLARIKAQQEPTDEELRRSVEVAQARAEERVRQQVSTTVKTVIPMAVRAVKVKRTIEDGVQSAKAKAKELATEKARALAETIRDTVDPDGAGSFAPVLKLVGQIQDEPDEDSHGSATLPAELVVAGLLAPLEIQVLASWNRLAVSLTATLLLVFAWALAFDVRRECGIGRVWLWMLVMAAILAATVAARLQVLSAATALLRELQATHCSHHHARSNIADLQESLRERSGAFFEVLVGCDAIMNSAASSCLNFLNVAYVVWGAVGVAWTAQDVVVNSTHCDALESRRVMNVYAFIYVMLLSVTVPALLLWILDHILSYRCAVNKLIDAARKADEAHLGGAPLLTWLARALLLRRASDVAGGERRDRQSAVDELSKRKEDLERRSSGLAEELRAKRERMHELEKQESEQNRKVLVGEAVEEPGDALNPAVQKAARAAALAALAQARGAGVDLEDLRQPPVSTLHREDEGVL